MDPRLDPNYERHQAYIHAHPTDELVRIKKQNKVSINNIIDLTKKRRANIIKQSEEKQKAKISDVADYFLNHEVSNKRDIHNIVQDIDKSNS